VIEDRRDRLTTMLVAPLMSCSARLPVYVLLIGAFLTAGRPRWLPGTVMAAMYGIGFVIAPLVALMLRRTLLKGPTPIFVLEMPSYKWPSPRAVFLRAFDASWAFVRRAGTMILASMVIVWALLYFPHTNQSGESYDALIAAASPGAEAEASERIREIQAEQTRGSILGQAGRALEPIFAPLGWDWRIGMATLASFPAREVVVGTLGMIYQTDTDEEGEEGGGLGAALRSATWDDAPQQPVFTIPTVLSVLVFFALCCQCVSTLAVIRRETKTWRWPVFTFVYMTALAYFAAFAVYQLGSIFA
jgi:ferrous iron transport protein B